MSNKSNEYYYKNKEPIKTVNSRCRQKNRAILYELKINGCAICGYGKCDRALDFHNVNSKDKKFNINLRHMGNKNITTEMQKCILLCKNCHMEIHEKARGIGNV